MLLKKFCITANSDNVKDSSKESLSTSKTKGFLSFVILRQNYQEHPKMFLGASRIPKEFLMSLDGKFCSRQDKIYRIYRNLTVGKILKEKHSKLVILHEFPIKKRRKCSFFRAKFNRIDFVEKLQLLTDSPSGEVKLLKSSQEIRTF